MKKSDTSKSYAELSAQLDEVMAAMQDPACDVDQAAKLYEQALGYIVQLEQRLEQTENQVAKVHADFMARQES